MEPTTIEKIVEVDKHIGEFFYLFSRFLNAYSPCENVMFLFKGCAVSGLIADSRTMVDRARMECQNHWFTYNEKMSVESVAQAVSNLAIQFGDSDDDGGAMVSSYNVRIINDLVYPVYQQSW